MKLRLAMLCGMLALPGGVGADWRDTLSPVQPGSFPLPAPFEATYRFGWGAVAAAEGTFAFAHPAPGEIQLQVKVNTIGMVRTLWRMDARHVARAEAVSLRPRWLEQTEIYADETLKTKAEFSAEAVVRRQERDPAERTPPKEKRFKSPGLFDLHTALLFVRSQPLHAGDVYRLLVYPAKAPYLATVRVVGGDRLKVAGRDYRAVKLQLELQRVAKNHQLETHKKFKRATAWISDDRDRHLLKVQSDVFVGSVWTELESVKAREPSAAAVRR